MLQPRQDDLLARLFNLAGQEDFVENGVDLRLYVSLNSRSPWTSIPPLLLLCSLHPHHFPPFCPQTPHSIIHRALAANKTTTHLVKVEDQVELADVAEKGVEHLDEKVNGLEVGQLVVVDVDAGAEEEARVPAVDDLGRVAELDKVGLVLLVARRDQAVDLQGGDGGAVG